MSLSTEARGLPPLLPLAYGAKVGVYTSAAMTALSAVVNIGGCHVDSTGIFLMPVAFCVTGLTTVIGVISVCVVFSAMMRREVHFVWLVLLVMIGICLAVSASVGADTCASNLAPLGMD